MGFDSPGQLTTPSDPDLRHQHQHLPTGMPYGRKFERLLKHVYPEISNVVKEEKFLELYEHATDNDHDALIIINHNDMEKKIQNS